MIIQSESHVTEAVLAEYGRCEDVRLREIMQALIRHLHAFVREVHLTEREFDAALKNISRLGQMTTESHNETRLMAGTLGISTLVCLLNNGEQGTADTTANLLGPFWREGAPSLPNGASILRSNTIGVPVFVTGTVLDKQGLPVVGADVDVWHASPIGLYENQDPDQAEMNLRGRFRTDSHGIFSFKSVKPAGYPVPMGGPVGELITAFDRHPFRPAHLHALIYKDGFKTIASQLYSSDDPKLESDAQFGVTRNCVANYQLHRDRPAPDNTFTGEWYSLEHTFILEAGDKWLPTPPVSKKRTTHIGQIAENPNGRIEA